MIDNELFDGVKGIRKIFNVKYTFNPSTKAVTFTSFDASSVDNIYAIYNATTNQILFQKDSINYSGNISGNVLTYTIANVSGTSSTDILKFYINCNLLFFPEAGTGGGGAGDASAANQITANNLLTSIDTDIGATTAAEATGDGSLIAITKRIRTLLTGMLNPGTGPMSSALRITSAEARSTTGTQENAPALNRELLTNSDNGWYDAKDFNLVSFSIVTGAGISAGILTFESTDDLTVTGQQQPARIQNNTTTAPVTTLTLAASVTNRYIANLTARYFRIRVSTAVVGGTVQAFATFRQTPFSDQGLAISAVNTLGTITPGTGATNLGKAEDAVAASGDTGLFALGVRRDALTTSASATGDYNEISTNRFGAIYFAGFRTAARTYSASARIALASAATDIMALFGNATTTVAITKLRVTGIQTTSGSLDILLGIRTTANSGGTSSNFSLTRHEQTDSANSSTPIAYTANPTSLGTLAGIIRRFFLPVGTLASALSQEYTLEFGENGKPIILSGTAQGLVLNLNGVTVAGGELDVTIEWYEF